MVARTMLAACKALLHPHRANARFGDPVGWQTACLDEYQPMRFLGGVTREGEPSGKEMP
jgi:hypothetical protein